jgi:hypothetical protein
MTRLDQNIWFYLSTNAIFTAKHLWLHNDKRTGLTRRQRWKFEPMRRTVKTSCQKIVLKVVPGHNKMT